MCLSQAQAGKWPDRPIHLIVPFDAGGSVDAVARLLADKITKDVGQTVIIDNRGGAGGLIAFQQVAQAKPDGYTLLLGASSYTTIAATRKLTFDPVKDVTPIMLIDKGPLILAVSADSPIHTLPQFIAALKAKPGEFNFGTPGVGSATQFAGVHFQQLSGTSMRHIPYKSDGLALLALQANDIQVVLASGPQFVPLLKAGQARALAVTSDHRWPTFPGLPTTSEVVPGSQYMAWHALWGPPGIPADVVTSINQAFTRALELPEVKERLRLDVREAAPSGPEELKQLFSHEIAEWSSIAKSANIKLEN